MPLGDTSPKYAKQKKSVVRPLTLLHSKRPKLYGVLAVLRAIGLMSFSLSNTSHNIVPLGDTSPKYAKQKKSVVRPLTLLHSKRPKLYGVLAVLRAIGLMNFSLSNTSHNIVPPGDISPKYAKQKKSVVRPLTLLHSKRPKLYGVLAVLRAIGLTNSSLSNTSHNIVHPGDISPEYAKQK